MITKWRKKMNLQEILYKELSTDLRLQEELKEIIEKNVTKTVKINIDRNSSSEKIMECLAEAGVQVNQKNYRFFQSKLKEMNQNNEIQMSFTEQECINHLDSFSADDMNSLINVCLLRRLKKIEEKLCEEQLYEYDIQRVIDVKGATNISELSDMITQHAKCGYRVKNIFVNELGKNAMALLGLGINETADEVIILFERPICSEK